MKSYLLLSTKFYVWVAYEPVILEHHLRGKLSYTILAPKQDKELLFILAAYLYSQGGQNSQACAPTEKS